MKLTTKEAAVFRRYLREKLRMDLDKKIPSKGAIKITIGLTLTNTEDKEMTIAQAINKLKEGTNL